MFRLMSWKASGFCCHPGVVSESNPIAWRLLTWIVLVAWVFGFPNAGFCDCEGQNCVSPRFDLQDEERWLRTVNDMSPLERGDPVTLTWSIVRDGTPIVPRNESESDDPSNLVAVMNSLHGDSWQEIFVEVFDRYSSVSGLTYIHESNDDRSAIQQNAFSLGERNVRADIRIGGHQVDSGNALAYNHFPPNGDMVLDTSDDFLSVRSRLFNLVAHEHGHGLGLHHVHSNDSRPLMQPFISTDFQGPQFDDILGLHRLYGDALEKGVGNDSSATAFELGEYQVGQPLIIGDDAIETRVAFSQSDFVSIDGLSDVDFYSFSIDATTTVSFLLEPMGPTYSYGDSSSTQSLFDASSENDLSLELFRSGSQIPLATSADAGLGMSESIERILVGAGEYQIRVSGAHDAAQMYRLTVGEIPDSQIGDFDSNGSLDLDDIQQLIDQSLSGGFDRAFDLNSDNTLDDRDLEFWVHDLKDTFFGDSNLDGEFNSTDLVAVFTAAEYEDLIPGNSTWATGDWNGDGDFGSRDLIAAFQDAGFEKGHRAVQTVPEPTTTTLLAMVTSFVCLSANSRRKRKAVRHFCAERLWCA